MIAGNAYWYMNARIITAPILGLFLCLLIACKEKDQVQQYNLINLKIEDGKFYIRGVSVADIKDTFAQGFFILKKSADRFHFPEETKYQIKLTQYSLPLGNSIRHQDTFYVVLGKRTGEKFEKGIVRYFKFDNRYQKTINLFREGGTITPGYIYYLQAFKIKLE